MLSWFKGKTAKSPELKEAESVFTDEELKALHKLFQEELAHHAGPGTAGRAAAPARDGSLDVHRLGALLGPAWPCLDPLIASQLQRLVADRTDGRVRLSGIIIAMARAERLGEQASLEFTYGQLDVDGKGVGYRALEAAVLSCLRLTGAAPGPAERGAVADPRVSAAAPATGSGGGGGGGASSGAAVSTEKEGGTPSSAAGGEKEGGDTRGSGSSSSGGGGVPVSALQAQVAAICRGALAFAAAATGAPPPTGGRSADDVRLSYDEYCKWTKRCPALHKTLCTLLHRIGRAPLAATAAAAGTGAGATAGSGGGGGGGGAAASGQVLSSDPLRLPALTQLGKLPPAATLLQPAWVWALASRLPPAQRCEWRLLFSSQRDGKSFNTFFGRVSAAPGPTLLLIRDKSAGAVFGGYASQPWAKSGSYYGDVSSFIFSLLPVMQFFPATGINDNLQWCGVGFSQLPGGLGFGGAAAESARGHFALYVEPSLDAGMSRPMATYGNTPLASEQVFQIDTLECWLLQPPEEEEGQQQQQQQQDDPSAGGAGRGGGGGRRGGAGAGGGGSVLGKAAEDRAILELAGLNMHSAGMMDEPLEED